LPEEIKEERRRRKEISEKFAAQWSTPITFYGRVVDEKGDGVEGAEVKVGVNDASPQGSSEFTILSDESGVFTITNIKGKHLHIEASKQGFLAGRESFRSFAYAGGTSPFVPNPRSPEIFRLQRKGEAVPLVSFGRDLVLPTDGTFVGFSFLTNQKALSGNEDLRFSMKVSIGQGEEPTRFTWHLQMEVPEGGLVQTEDEFPTLAPTTGYQKSFQKSFQRGTKDWQDQFRGTFYVRTKDSNYAVIHVRFIAYGDRFVSVQGLLNPDGGRSLQMERGYKITVQRRQDGSISLIYPKGYEPKTP
jgi:hypothetical protein